MLEDVPVGVYGVFEVNVLDLIPDRLPVEEHEHGGLRTVKDLGWVGLDARGVSGGWSNPALVQATEQAIERDHHPAPQHDLLQIGHDLADLIARKRREVELSDPEVAEVDQT